eukprot:311033-Rhodomonas_salina.1
MDMQTNVDEAIRNAESRLRLTEMFIKHAEELDAGLQKEIANYWVIPANERDPKYLVVRQRLLQENMDDLEMYRQKA